MAFSFNHMEGETSSWLRPPHRAGRAGSAPLEQVGQRELRSAWAVEDVRLLDLHHGEPPPLGVQRVALAREALLLLEQLLARGEPLLAGDDLGQVRVHLKRTMARTSAPALSLAGALARRTRSPHRELRGLLLL